MNIKEAVDQYLAYQKSGLKPGTFRHYEKLLKDLQKNFQDRDIGEISYAELFAFLSPRTEGLKQITKHQKYACLMSFFNFCINVLEVTNDNPCNSALLRKTFRRSKLGRRTILSKEIIDETIFQTPSLRDRLFLEIQARSVG